MNIYIHSYPKIPLNSHTFATAINCFLSLSKGTNFGVFFH